MHVCSSEFGELFRLRKQFCPRFQQVQEEVTNPERSILKRPISRWVTASDVITYQVTSIRCAMWYALRRSTTLCISSRVVSPFARCLRCRQKVLHAYRAAASPTSNSEPRCPCGVCGEPVQRGLSARVEASSMILSLFSDMALLWTLTFDKRCDRR
jgi:hypothetical protein